MSAGVSCTPAWFFVDRARQVASGPLLVTLCDFSPVCVTGNDRKDESSASAEVAVISATSRMIYRLGLVSFRGIIEFFSAREVTTI